MIPFRALSTRLAAVLLAAAFAVFASQPAYSLSAADKKEVEQVIRDYLMKNPELLRDVMQELEKKMAAEENERRSGALKEFEKLIYDSPRGVVVGNPKGDVTVVEFFDHNCGYCKRAMDDMMKLVSADSMLKFILKEFPVLGQSSLDAARIAVAVRMQDKDSKKYLKFHQTLMSGRGEVNRDRAMAAAKDAGADMAKLEADLKSPEIDATLQESGQLADALGISGTPSYVMPNEVVPGAVGMAELKKRVDAVRKCGKATC
jgi:protein-disulfide isomerase